MSDLITILDDQSALFTSIFCKKSDAERYFKLLLSINLDLTSGFIFSYFVFTADFRVIYD